MPPRGLRCASRCRNSRIETEVSFRRKIVIPNRCPIVAATRNRNEDLYRTRLPSGPRYPHRERTLGPQSHPAQDQTKARVDSDCIAVLSQNLRTARRRLTRRCRVSGRDSRLNQINVLDLQSCQSLHRRVQSFAFEWRDFNMAIQPFVDRGPRNRNSSGHSRGVRFQDRSHIGRSPHRRRKVAHEFFFVAFSDF
jgi:hypothetical protein